MKKIEKNANQKIKKKLKKIAKKRNSTWIKRRWKKKRN